MNLSADACIKCTVCTTACPVVPLQPRFPGPKYGGPELWRVLRALPPEAAASEAADLDACTNCQLCQTACPQGGPVAWLLAWNRDRLRAGRPPTWRDRMLGRPDLLGRRLRRWRGLPGRLWPLVAAPLRLARQRPYPRPQAVPFRTWFRARPAGATASPRGRVALYVDCHTQEFDKGAAVALVGLLERLGYAVVLSPESPGCCGAAWIAQGRPGKAVPLAEGGAAALAALAGDGVPILALNSTCGPTVAREWADLLGVRAAASLAAAVWDAADFLLERVGVADLRRVLGPVGGPASPIAYHDTCRLRGQGNGAPGARLLSEVLGASVRLLGLDCCGMGGAYGSKAERYRTSLALGRRAVEGLAAARAAGMAFVVTDSGPCGWQLQHVSGLPARHPIEVLVGIESGRADPA
jgi:glycerol-3-phosphate dehydrogenase subunit C